MPPSARATIDRDSTRMPEAKKLIRFFIFVSFFAGDRSILRMGDLSDLLSAGIIALLATKYAMRESELD